VGSGGKIEHHRKEEQGSMAQAKGKTGQAAPARIRTREAILSKGEALSGEMLVAQLVTQSRTVWLLTISAVKGDSARTISLSKKEWAGLKALVEGKK
jgi:hypothetical protein